MTGLELMGFLVFSAQQAGVAIGVGGAAVELGLALRSIGGMASETANSVTRVGFWLVVLSGALITFAHVIAGEEAAIFTPAYLFKWGLIALILVFNIVAIVTRSRKEPHAPITGLLVGTWFALFALHTLSPANASWAFLTEAYAGWMILFFGGYLLIEKYSSRSLDFSLGNDLLNVSKEPVQTNTALIPPPPPVPEAQPLTNSEPFIPQTSPEPILEPALHIPEPEPEPTFTQTPPPAPPAVPVPPPASISESVIPPPIPAHASMPDPEPPQPAFAPSPVLTLMPEKPATDSHFKSTESVSSVSFEENKTPFQN